MLEPQLVPKQNTFTKWLNSGWSTTVWFKLDSSGFAFPPWLWSRMVLAASVSVFNEFSNENKRDTVQCVCWQFLQTGKHGFIDNIAVECENIQEGHCGTLQMECNWMYQTDLKRWIWGFSTTVTQSHRVVIFFADQMRIYEEKKSPTLELAFKG